MATPQAAAAATEDDFGAGFPDEWEPSESERKYFRHVTSGDLGYMVRREGKTCIRLDRPMEDISKPYRKHEWLEDRERRPLNRAQVIQIAFEADRKLCTALGMHDLAKREWLNLTDEQKIVWIQEGPSNSLERIKLYKSITKALEYLTR